MEFMARDRKYLPREKVPFYVRPIIEVEEVKRGKRTYEVRTLLGYQTAIDSRIDTSQEPPETAGRPITPKGLVDRVTSETLPGRVPELRFDDSVPSRDRTNLSDRLTQKLREQGY
tara:strand:+ start:485 stop:829 length:345 start_codon:yes stop_codon:yes gene_type:complete